MNAVDVAALEKLAEGEGEMRVGKKLMRSLLARAKAPVARPRRPIA